MKGFIEKLIERFENRKQGKLNLYCDALDYAIRTVNELAEEYQREQDVLLDLLAASESDYICDELSVTDYCIENCKYTCPQKECYMKYAEMKVQYNK